MSITGSGRVVAAHDDLEGGAVTLLTSTATVSSGAGLGRDRTEAVDAGLVEVPPGEQVGGLHDRREVAAPAVAVEVDVPARWAATIPAASSGFTRP